MARPLAVALLMAAVALSGCVLDEEAGCAAECGPTPSPAATGAASATASPTPALALATPTESASSSPSPTPEPSPTPVPEPSSATETSSTTPTHTPPRADEVEVRGVIVDTGPNWARISWTVWPEAPDVPIRIEVEDGMVLAECFCPTQPQLVDGRYVSEVSTLAGGTQMRFLLRSYLATKSESGGTRYSPVTLHEGTFTTTHAPLAIQAVSGSTRGTTIWFQAETTGDGKLYPTFRWTDANGTTDSMAPSLFETQGHMSMGTGLDPHFGPGPYTAVMELRNDRGEQAVSEPFEVHPG